jgi:hypothetical protein
MFTYFWVWLFAFNNLVCVRKRRGNLLATYKQLNHEISADYRFRRRVNEIFALLGSYAAQIRSYLPAFLYTLSVPKGR